MTSGHVFIATSLDGFIAREDGALDWLDKQNVSGEDHGYEAFMETVDGLVMGRNTFEKVLSFDCDWPYKKSVQVMSKSLSQANIPTALQDTVHVTDLEPRPLMAKLSEEGWKRAYVDGGKVVQSFLKAKLIEDLHISQMPILIGKGAPLFGDLTEDIDLELLGSRTFKSGVVEVRYRVIY